MDDIKNKSELRQKRDTFRWEQKTTRKENRDQLVTAVREKKSSIRTGSSYSAENGQWIDAVLLPEKDTDINEWIAANTVDFFNELTILWEYCKQDPVFPTLKAGEGFPKHTRYVWEGQSELSGPQYVYEVFCWLDDLIQDNKIFVTDVDQAWPEDFLTVHMKKAHQRMFRVFAIIFHVHSDYLAQQKAKIVHLKAAFKHFIFFACHWNTFDCTGDDVRPLKDDVAKLVVRYRKEFSEWEKDNLKPFPVKDSEAKGANNMALAKRADI